MMNLIFVSFRLAHSRYFFRGILGVKCEPIIILLVLIMYPGVEENKFRK